MSFSYAQDSKNSTETSDERKKREIEGSGDVAGTAGTTTTTATENPTTTPEFQVNLKYTHKKCPSNLPLFFRNMLRNTKKFTKK